jgi:hypothetical protein
MYFLFLRFQSHTASISFQHPPNARELVHQLAIFHFGCGSFLLCHMACSSSLLSSFLLFCALQANALIHCLLYQTHSCMEVVFCSCYASSLSNYILFLILNLGMLMRGIKLKELLEQLYQSQVIS